jgi:hypothetical protein
MRDLPTAPNDSDTAGHASSTPAARQDTTSTDRPAPRRTAEQLAEIRTSLHAATEARDDLRLRRQHAHHAADLAADVILRRDCTEEQRRTAGIYLNQAVAMRGDRPKAR